MKTKPDIVKLWTCPKCGRRFERRGQSHSCRLFLLAHHFEGKPEGKRLYDILKRAVNTKVGSFKIESLECCIHFVSTFTFTAVKIFKDKIRVDFSLDRQLNSNRVKQFVRMSAHRILYFIDVMKEEEIDAELMGWMLEAKDKKPGNLATG